jgi:hypothetical protein
MAHEFTFGEALSRIDVTGKPPSGEADRAEIAAKRRQPRAKTAEGLF